MPSAHDSGFELVDGYSILICFSIDSAMSKSASSSIVNSWGGSSIFIVLSDCLIVLRGAGAAPLVVQHLH